MGTLVPVVVDSTLASQVQAGGSLSVNALQIGPDLTTGLQEQVNELKHDLKVLTAWLIAQGVDMPDELTDKL